jgi:hypothetical protein
MTRLPSLAIACTILLLGSTSSATLAMAAATSQLPAIAPAKPVTPTLTIAGATQGANTRVSYYGSLIVPSDGQQPSVTADGHGQLNISMGATGSYSGSFTLTFAGTESFHTSKNAPQAAVEYTATGENLVIVCPGTGTLYRMSIATATPFSASLQKSLKNRLWSFPAGMVTAKALSCSGTIRTITRTFEHENGSGRVI